MFKKIFLALIVLGLLAGGGGVAWFKFMRPVDPFAAAKAAMERGDIRAAQIELRNTVRKDPNNAEAHFRLGVVQLRMGDPVSAERSLRQALDNGFDPRPVRPLLAQTYMAQGKFRDLLRDFPADTLPPDQKGQMQVLRGMAHLQLGELDQAFQNFTEAERAMPQAAEPVLAAARVLMARRDFAGAEARVDRALTLNAKSADALVLKAQLLNLRGDRRNALSALDSAVQFAPGMLAARLERANLLVALGDDAKAKEDVTAVLRMEPRSAGGIYLQSVIAARAREFAAADAGLTQIQNILGRFPRGYYFQAVVKFNLGQAEQANEAATRFLSRNPNDLDGLKLMARIHMAAQRPQEAIDVLVKAEEEGVKPDGEMLDLLGRAYAQSGRPQLALPVLERAAEIAPDNADILTRLAAIRLGLGDAAGAAKDLEQSVEMSPKRVDASEALIVAALANGEVDRAAAALDRVKQTGVRSENIGILEGMVRTGQLNFEAAKAAYANVLREYPASVRARMNLARMAMLEAKGTEAEQYLVEILRQEPANEAALNVLLQLLIADGKLDRAIGYVETARAAAPGNVGITVLLADLYLRNREARKALDMVEAAQKDQPPSPALIMARARAQVALGLVREAQEAFRVVLANNPNDANARRALVELMLRDNSAEAAKALLRDGLAQSPGNPALLQTLVAIDLREGGADKALATLAELRQDPRNVPGTRGLRGDILMSANRHQEAAQAYIDEAKETPTADLVQRTVAALNAGGRQAESARLLREWLGKNPDDQQARMMLIGLDLAARRLDEAEKLLGEVLEKQPGNVIALNNLAWLYHQKNDDRARAMAQRAYLLGPTAHVADTFGWILTTQGDAVLALPLLRQAARELPTEPSVQYHYAVALNEAGQKEEAANVLRPIVQGTANFPEKTEATRLYESLARR
jgi:putative PEP-CTERM system TPR-repeat lipoprotein